MAISYTPTQWRNGQLPAVNETNLNHLEQGVKAVSDACPHITISASQPSGGNDGDIWVVI